MPGHRQALLDAGTDEGLEDDAGRLAEEDAERLNQVLPDGVEANEKGRLQPRAIGWRSRPPEA